MRNQVLNILAECGDNISVFEWNDSIDVTICDFNGFDENWEEIMIEYDDKAVKKMRDKLAEIANEVQDDFYTRYVFDGFYVEIGYASYDI